MEVPQVQVWGDKNSDWSPQILFVRIKHMFGPPNLGLGGTKTVLSVFRPPTRNLDLFFIDGRGIEINF